MARTIETREVTVVGGPKNGLRMQAKLKDDGSAEFPNGAIFLGEDAALHYTLDRETNEVRYLGDA